MANVSLGVTRPTATDTEPALFAVKLSMGLGGLVLVLLMLLESVRRAGPRARDLHSGFLDVAPFGR